MEQLGPQYHALGCESNKSEVSCRGLTAAGGRGREGIMEEHIGLVMKIKSIESICAEMIRFTLRNDDTISEDWLREVALKRLLEQLKEFRD